MNVEDIRKYCLQMKGVTEGFPFDETTLVLKVGEKIFALMNLHANPSLNLKCDPERAIDLRERYDSIIPGYHMNKKHWNTLALDGSLTDDLIIDLIVHSYDLVLAILPKKAQDEIANL